MSLLTNKRISLLKNILNLRIIPNNENESSIDILLAVLLTKFDKRNNLDCITEYVESWLLTHFDTSYGTDNFIMSNPKNWQYLFESLNMTKDIDVDNDLECILISQLILSLCKISIINLQKLANSPEVRSILQKCIFAFKYDNDNGLSIPIETKKLIELYSKLISVTCSTKEVMDIVSELPSNISFKIFEHMCFYMSNLSLMNHIIFENYCNHIVLQKGVEIQIKNITIQLWLELNNIIHNRILTLDGDLIIEIQDGKLCLCNHEFIIGLFDSFTFDSKVLYQISLCYEYSNNEYSLYVNGDLKHQLAIFKNTIPKVTYVDVGSTTCSFKLYALNIWSMKMTEDVIKVTYNLGPTYNPQMSSNDQYWGIIRNFQDDYLEILYFKMESTNLSLEEFYQHLKSLTLKNLVFHYDLENTIEQFRKHSTLVELNCDYGNKLNLAKSYFLYTDNLQSKLITINIFKIIVFNIQLAKNQEIILQYTTLLINLCNDPKLLLFFQKSVGFDLLAHILYQSYIENFKKGLSIEFLNLFLQFCGWNFVNIENSMLKNIEAYQHLITNLDLWLKPLKSHENGNTELLRYIFFHISMFQDGNKYRKYNSVRLKKLDVFTTLCFYLYHNKNQIFQEIDNTIVFTLHNLIINDSSKENCTFIWQIIILSLENDKLHNISVFVDSLDCATKHCKTVNDYSVWNTISINLLFSIIISMNLKGLKISVLLKILFQKLSVEKTLCKNFLKQNGINLLFGVLTKCNINCLFDILPMMLKFSTNIDICKSFYMDNAVDFQYSDFGSRLPFLCLCLKLVEWMVHSSMQISPEKNVPKFLHIFLSKIIDFVGSDENSNINNSMLLPYLSSLLFTLLNLNNPELYQDTSKILINFISARVIKAIKLKQDIRVQLENLCGFRTYFDRDYLKMHSLQNSDFLDLIFVQIILPHVLKELLVDELKLISELENNIQMIKNILELFDKLKSYYMLITDSSTIITQSYELLFICGEIILPMNPPSTKLLSKYSMLLSYFLIYYCSMVLNNNINIWNISDREMFDLNLVKYQSSIYGVSSHNNLHAVIQYLLFVLIYRLCLGQSSKMLIPAIRALLIFNYERLGDLIKTVDQSNELIKNCFEEFLLSDEEVILSKTDTIVDLVLNDTTLSFYRKKVNEYSNVWSKTDQILKEDLNKIILERQQRYNDFSRSKSDMLNMSLIENTKEKIKIINDMLLKKCNNYLIKIQEGRKIQENRKRQINFEIRHLWDMRDRKKINNMTIDNEENSERMRLKIVPW